MAYRVAMGYKGADIFQMGKSGNLVGWVTDGETFIDAVFDEEPSESDITTAQNIYDSHRYGELSAELTGTNTYTVTVTCDEPDGTLLTPVVDDTEGNTIEVTSGVATFEIETTLPVAVSIIELSVIELEVANG